MDAQRECRSRALDARGRLASVMPGGENVVMRPRSKAGPQPAAQAGGFQMMTFFFGSSPGALATLP